MAIFRKTGQTESITEGWRALELFTDRHEAIRHFLSYLHADPPKERILFFTGEGGNGKSLLLQFLRTHCCKRLHAADWEYVRTVPQIDLEPFLKRVHAEETLPSISLDFGQTPRAQDRPQEPFAALLMLRRQCAHYQLRLPFYDYACIHYLHATAQLTQERLKDLFPAFELGFLSELANLISGTSYGTLANAVLNLCNRNFGRDFTLYMRRRQLTVEQVENVQRMDAERELVEVLPQWFAQDLNTAMTMTGAPRRLVLFFDTHEAFWGAMERSSGREQYFQRDEWLRRLVGHLALDQGLIVAMAGREAPRWAQAGRWQIPADFFEIRPIGNLTEPDAIDYLERAGVTDTELRQALVRYGTVTPGEVHPFYLGLCADVALAAAPGDAIDPETFPMPSQLATREQVLLDRLLRYVDNQVEYAVRALGACRAFSRELYTMLGEALHFESSEPMWQVLLGFSFVWRAEAQGEGWYQIHDLVRRLLHTHAVDVTLHAHTVLEQHYRTQSSQNDPVAIAEAIYHAHHCDRNRSISEWITVFRAALQQSAYAQCQSLLSVRNEMTISTDFQLGQVSQFEGDYWYRLARYDIAIQEYQEAIAAYDTALAQAPDDVEVHNNRGIALQSLGDVQASLSQHADAIESYQGLQPQVPVNLR